ncbi:MAG: DUF350 domain-containing protein [Maricaulaceae bacterium]
MGAAWQSFAAGFPVLLTHLAVSAALLAAFMFLYVKMTPYKELGLVREGNTAAAVSFGAIIVGLSVPMAFCLAASVSLADIAIWGAATLFLQMLTFRLVDLIIRDLPRRIEAGEMAAAVLLAAFKLAAAALISAAVAG